jgi:ATP-dependent RNA helicase RhlE
LRCTAARAVHVCRKQHLTQFTDLELAAPLLKALAAEGYERPTPIQAQAIPHLLAGRDLLGVAQTGTGKTAAFALPILQRLAANRIRPSRGNCRALILSPTRELARQIADNFHTYGRHYGFRISVIFGGVGHRPQADALARGLDILVATPGRLIDHLDNGALNLGGTEAVVLDEADHMLDLGFIHAIRKIVAALPKQRQSLFFSATMPKEMAALAATMLNDPVRVAVTPAAKTADRVEQRVMLIESSRKRALLAELLQSEQPGRALVFARTKHGADRIVRQLAKDGFQAAAIHGNKSQGQRERVLADFRSGRAPVLIATDVAARGIDVEGVTHVINFDLPNTPESYVHRIGRTARAGAEGVAISFCDVEERACLRDIERLIRQNIPAIDRRQAESAATAEQSKTEVQRGAHSGAGKRGEANQPQGQRRPAKRRQPDGRRDEDRRHAAASPARPNGGAKGTKAKSLHNRRGGDQRGGGDLAGISFMQAPRRKQTGR